MHTETTDHTETLNPLNQLQPLNTLTTEITDTPERETETPSGATEQPSGATEQPHGATEQPFGVTEQPNQDNPEWDTNCTSPENGLWTGGPPIGETGQPRAQALRRPTPKSTAAQIQRARNRNRGLRSITATQNRKAQRITKKQVYRKSTQQAKYLSAATTCPTGDQQVQDPNHKHKLRVIKQQLVRPSLRSCKRRHHCKLRVATLNCRGMVDPIKRQLIDQWLIEKNIDILLLQETNVKSNEKG